MDRPFKSLSTFFILNYFLWVLIGWPELCHAHLWLPQSQLRIQGILSIFVCWAHRYHLTRSRWLEVHGASFSVKCIWGKSWVTVAYRLPYLSFTALGERCRCGVKMSEFKVTQELWLHLWGQRDIKKVDTENTRHIPITQRRCQEKADNWGSHQGTVTT